MIEELRQRAESPREVLFLVTGRRIEEQVLSGEQVEQIVLESADSRSLGRRPWQGLTTLWKSVRRARELFRKRRPSCLIGTGGYGSLPGVFAAWREGIPVVLLEQNVVPGRATTVLSRFATEVCVSFEQTLPALPGPPRVSVTGNPVRRRIALLSSVPVDARHRRLLVLGGSQGATAVNRAMAGIVQRQPGLLSGWEVIHQTGRPDEVSDQSLSSAYRAAGVEARVEPFFDMAAVFPHVALVVSRAGATSLAEFACAGLPAILIPYPRAVRDHQRHNAAWYADRGGAVVVQQADHPEPFPDRLAGALSRFLENGELRDATARAMHSLARPAAAQQVADVVLRVIEQSEPR